MMLTALEDAGAPFGLVESDDKMRSLPVNSTDNSTLQTGSGVIQQCQSFVYLGCMVPDVDAEMKRRKAFAWAAMGKLQPIWSFPALFLAKARLFERMIELILFYGAESWSLSATGESVLEGIHARLLRAATGTKLASAHHHYADVQDDNQAARQQGDPLEKTSATGDGKNG